MPFVYRRTIRFHETDAAGVVYFAALLSLCHEAYEAAIAAHSSLNPRQFFSGAAITAVPIVHTAADFYQPLFCGDSVAIAIAPQQLTPHSFEITYTITAIDGAATDGAAIDSAKPRPLVQASTRHVCIATASRRRVDLPIELVNWIAHLAELEPESSAPDG